MNGDFSIDSALSQESDCSGRKQPPTAIFCFNDEMAMGVIHTARRRKMRIPDDLSVVGVDDIRYARYTDPPLTTVAQPMRQMGENAVRVLLDILNGGNGAPEQVTLPPTLVVRREAPRRPGRWLSPPREFGLTQPLQFARGGLVCWRAVCRRCTDRRIERLCQRHIHGIVRSEVPHAASMRKVSRSRWG
jgi:hypothetical protein